MKRKVLEEYRRYKWKYLGLIIRGVLFSTFGLVMIGLVVGVGVLTLLVIFRVDRGQADIVTRAFTCVKVIVSIALVLKAILSLVHNFSLESHLERLKKLWWMGIV